MNSSRPYRSLKRINNLKLCLAKFDLLDELKEEDLTAVVGPVGGDEGVGVKGQTRHHTQPPLRSDLNRRKNAERVWIYFLKGFIYDFYDILWSKKLCKMYKKNEILFEERIYI